MPEISHNLGFHHVYEPSNRPENAFTLLLLHGTGGDEHDLRGLGRALAPTANLLSPRGKVLEGRMNRFFRRIAEGVFDLEDLKFRTAELAEFVERAAAEYKFDLGAVVAVGFSNGANIAASLLLTRPDLLAGGALLHAMVPMIPEHDPDLTGKHVFLGAGASDPISTPEETARLAQMLRRCGAEVEVFTHPGGHSLTQSEFAAAKTWLTRAC